MSIIDKLDLCVKQTDINNYYMMDNRKKVTTLNNLGNTCFFNSFIQCLIHIDDFVNNVCRMGNDIKKLEDNMFMKTFVNFVEIMHDNSKSNNISPKGLIKIFYNRIGKKNLEQEDAHEMMFSFLDIIHDITSYKVNFKDLNDHYLINKSIKELNNISMSAVNEYFMGQYHQRVQCCDCRNINHSFPIFSSLMLDVDNDQDYKNIYDCLNNFTQREELDEYKCEKCNNTTKAFKKITIWRLPKILIFTLKRFDAMQKNNKFIDYPIADLELTQYMTYPKTSSKKYNLYATIYHQGRMNIGHYYSIVNINDNWIYLNDELTKKIDDVPSLVNRSAYILFYKRI